MVSPIMWFDPTQRAVPPTAEKQGRSPTGMTVVSPSSSTVDTPSTIGQITPTRKMLFERTPHQRASLSQARSNMTRRSTSGHSVESRQEEEMEDLRTSNQQKDDQLRVLHQRFHNIQQGLGSIDQERNSLVEKAKQLEKEKRQIQKQLALREREIQALVKRCAFQEEKMRESSRLRVQNRELTQVLDSIQSQLADGDKETEDLMSLRTKLQESELQREKLQMRLQRLQREHDSIAKTLQECLGNIRQLTEEKQQVEEERGRERKRAELEMERQRLAHAHDMETKQSKIDQMERILQDNMYMKNSLRREKSLRQQEEEKIVADYEKRIAELEEKLDRRSEYPDENYEEALTLLRQKVEEKDMFVRGLKDEFSGQMGELMKKQTYLDEVEAEKKLLQTKIEKLERLECEHSALVDYVDILDSNLADLTNENAYLTIDKESLEEERVTIHRKMAELEYQLSRQQQHRQAREGDFRDLLEAEKEELRAELEASLVEARNEATSLQSELTTQSRWIEKLEAALNEGRRDVVEKEKQIRELQWEKDEISNAIEHSLTKARTEVSQLESDVQIRDDQIRSIQRTLETARCEYNQHKLQVMRLEADTCANDPAEASSEQEDTDAKRVELEEHVQELGSLVTNLNEMRKLLLEEMRTERASKNEMEQKKTELEIQLQNAQRQLQSYEGEIKSLADANVSLQRDAEEVRQASIQSAENSSKAILQSKQLDTELAGARSLLDKSRNEVDALQKDLETTHLEKASFVNALEEAKRQIEALQKDLGNKEKKEKELKAARDALSEQIEKNKNIEEEYSASLNAQSEKEASNRQSSTRIAILETQIVELKNELKDSAKVLASKDRQMRLVELEKEEFEKRAVSLSGQLDENRNLLESAEQSLKKKTELDVLLKSELEDAAKVMASHEKRIKEMNAALSENDKLRSDLVSQLAGSATKIHSLEQEIMTLKARSTSLDEHLQVAIASISDSEAKTRNAELKFEEKSLEMSKLEEEYKSVKQSKSETDDELSACKSRLASLEGIVNSAEKAYAALEHDIEKSNNQLATVEAEKKTLQEMKSILEKDLMASNKTSDEQYQELKLQHAQACETLSAKDSLIESLEDSIQNGNEEAAEISSRLSDSRNKVESLQGEISKRVECIEGLERHVDILRSNEKEIRRAFADSETKRGNLENELEGSRATVDVLSKRLEEREARLLELEERLQDSKQYATNVQEDLEVQLAEERKRHSVTTSKLTSAEVKIIEEKERYHDKITEQEDEIESLRAELKETAESKDTRYRAKEAEANSIISKLQTTIALKDDEIQELRVIELTDKEETIASLSESLEKLKAQMGNSEADMTRASNDLKRENKNLKSRLDEQERETLLILEQQEEELTKKDQRLHDLETEKLKVELQLAERLGAIADLTEREAELQKQERVLLSSCDQLIQSENSAKEELDRMKHALDVSIIKSKDNLDLQRQELETKFRKESEEMTSKLRVVEKKFQETDRVMKERTTLLGEMVEHNKDLESKLNKQLAQVCALEEENSRCQKELSETQTELLRTREELRKRENELTSKLNEERSHRDNAERSLAKLKVQFKEATKSKKMAAELERENSALKDKISRQEAFLQRKLQKEKIQRVRVIPSDEERTSVRKGASSNSSVVLETPPRRSRPSFLKTPSSTSSKIPSIYADDSSQRSGRSVATTGTSSSLQRLKSRSVIPSINATTSSETI